MTRDDPWAKWRAALVAPHKIGTGALILHPDTPWTGFYRVRRKGGDWEPVQFWQGSDGTWYAVRNGEPVDANRVEDLWSWACREPISEMAYDRALAGEGWADEPERAPGIGHNSGEADPFDALSIEYAGERDLVEQFLKKPIGSKEEADQAAILLKRFRELGQRADKLHAEEKAPHIVAAKRVDAKWKELRDGPAGYATLLKRHQTEWLKEQERRERERVARAAEEAERLRREAQDAARGANSPEAQAAAGEKIAAAKEAEREAEYRRPQAGRTGEKTSLKTYRSGLITDFETFIKAVKDEPEIKEASQRVANRLARQQRPVAGMEVVEDQRAV